jgi:hypothetical protein
MRFLLGRREIGALGEGFRDVWGPWMGRVEEREISAAVGGGGEGEDRWRELGAWDGGLEAE